MFQSTIMPSVLYFSFLNIYMYTNHIFLSDIGNGGLIVVSEYGKWNGYVAGWGGNGTWCEETNDYSSLHYSSLRLSHRDSPWFETNNYSSLQYSPIHFRGLLRM